jgi:Na+/proline symporter
MNLRSLDIVIIVGYFLTVVLVGLWVSRRGAKDMDTYFLGGKSLPWYMLGISDASGMFDISGTMWLVYILFVYGLKSLWLPWLWPTFNQIFLMMFLSGWLRRSNVLTGAEWIQTRFGRDTGANLAHLSVVFFALVNVIGLLAYAFKGIGEFIVRLLPWHFDGVRHFVGSFLPASVAVLFSDENIYAIIILGVTSLYVIKGGMISVVITEVMQFTILTLSALAIGCIAIYKVSPGMISHVIPAGWANPLFGWKLDLDWTGILDKVNNAIHDDGNDLFGLIFGMMFFKGVLASLAGPAPNYDMQRILATRNPREACMMNGMVNVVLYFPRYLMIAGVTVMALAFCMPELKAMDKPNFEEILPIVLFGKYLPAGVVGFLLAGLMAAFMSNFAATLNAAPAYLVNDVYKRFINPNSGGKAEVRMSRVVSLLFLVIGIVFGLVTKNITEVMMWLVGALYGGYVMANVLKWYWWRFNGYGYFWGMMAGIISAMIVPFSVQSFMDHRAQSFSAADITSASALAAQLRSPSPDGVSLYLSGQLTPATRELLARNPSGSDTNLSQVLAGELNQIIQGGSIYQTNRFAAVTLSSRTEDFLKKEHPTDFEARLLNRMLLESAFPSAIASRARFPVNSLYSFPFILALSILGSLLGTLWTKPEDDEILKKFYKTVNPWGAWGPIREKVMKDDPSFQPNFNMGRDCVNVIVGIIWQVSLTALPIYIVLRDWTWVGSILAALIVTSIFLKFNWYDKLEKA